MNNPGAHITDEQLRDPASRRRILESIPPNREAARENREALLRIFAIEADRRRREDEWTDAESEYYENLYWCAFLLYLAGEPRDAVPMWHTKYIDMGTGSGMDCQFLVGAGVDRMLRFLEDSGECEMLADIKEFQACGDFDYLEAWEKDRIRYFYGKD